MPDDTGRMQFLKTFFLMSDYQKIKLRFGNSFIQKFILTPERSSAAIKCTVFSVL